jgi:hypothetical protein
LLLAVGLFAVTPARACPCSDDAGSASSIVRGDERYALAIVATSRVALGRFDALGRYGAFRSGERETAQELLLRAGVRAFQRWEWLAELGGASYRLVTPSLSEQHRGVGDGLFHWRYEARDEDMPHERWRLPAVAVSAVLRAPFGSLAAGRSSGFGSGGAQLGLGAWELGGGLELKRAVAPSWELLLAGEAAYRFEDQVLGRTRRLGPRADAAVALRVLATDWFSTSLSLRARFTGDVTLEGKPLEGTAERLWSVVVGAAVYDRTTRFRSALTLSAEPPLETLSMGSTATAALSLSLGVGLE